MSKKERERKKETKKEIEGQKDKRKKLLQIQIGGGI